MAASGYWQENCIMKGIVKRLRNYCVMCYNHIALGHMDMQL